MKTNTQFWDSNIKKFPDSYKKWLKAEKEYLCNIITLNSKVLEIGCGTGRSISDMLPITKNITGIDHNQNAVEVAQNMFSGHSQVKIIKADAVNLPFEDECFDFVVCLATFVNFADKKITAIEEMKRVLKDSGKIILSVFSEDALEERMKVYTGAKSKIKEVINGKVVFDDIDSDDNISEQFSKEELETIFSKAKLNIENITKVSIAYLCTLTK